MANFRHRVMLQLRDVDSEEEREAILVCPIVSRISSNASALGLLEQSNRSDTRMEVGDNHTLLLTKKNQANNRRNCQQLRFDCVGVLNDPQTRAEYASLVDHLIMKQYNCCLLRFTVVRECNTGFLCNMLVREVDKRLQQLHAYVHSIRMEYYDVQKFDVVNLFDKAAKLGAPRTKRVLKPRPRNHFNNTLELLKWLQEQYPQLWAVGRGHDILEVNFKYSDIKRNMHRAKFALVQVYVNKMDLSTRTNLRNYLENISGEKRVGHNPLTDCLREYFSGQELWRTWMVFDVPRHRIKTFYVDDLLLLANAAYVGVNAMRSFNDSQYAGFPMDYNFSLDLNEFISKSSSSGKSVMSGSGASSSVVLTHFDLRGSQMSSRARRARSVKSVISGNKINNNNNNITNMNNNMLSHMINNKSASKYALKRCDSKDNLDYWYTKIDEKFATVIMAMESYYERKYDSRITQIGGDIKQMVRTMDQIGSQTSRGGDGAEGGGGGGLLSAKKKVTTVGHASVELREFQDQYISAVGAFQDLTKEIQRSKFGELLEVYLNTKNYELAQYAVRCKMQQLEVCQSQLSNIISKEMHVLNDQKKRNTEMLDNKMTLV